jgi:hypothetical protein
MVPAATIVAVVVVVVMAVERVKSHGRRQLQLMPIETADSGAGGGETVCWVLWEGQLAEVFTLCGSVGMLSGSRCKRTRSFSLLAVAICQVGSLAAGNMLIKLASQ